MFSLRTASMSLALDGALGLRLTSVGAGAFVQPQPVQTTLVGAEVGSYGFPEPSSVLERRCAYQSVRQMRGGFVGIATAAVDSLGALAIEDAYSVTPDGQGFDIRRTIAFSPTSPETYRPPADLGFASTLGLAPSVASARSEWDFFVPGVLYKDAGMTVADGAPISDPSSSVWTEDRTWINAQLTRLPLVMMRHRATGDTLGVVHMGPMTAPFVAEHDAFTPLWTMRADEQYPSIGISGTVPELAGVFTASEAGVWRRLDIEAFDHGGAWHVHPLDSSTVHSYTLRVFAWHSPSFADAVKTSWRRAFAWCAPPVRPVKPRRLYADVCALVRDASNRFQESDSIIDPGDYFSTLFWMNYPSPPLRAAGFPAIPQLFVANGQWSLPTLFPLPSGIRDPQQLVAAYLLRYGLEMGDSMATAKATAILDWWATNSQTETGLIRAAYDLASGALIASSHDNGYTDGLLDMAYVAEGVLRGYKYASAKGYAKPEWLQFAVLYGQFLKTAQHEDGSWPKAYVAGAEFSPDDPASTTLRLLRFAFLLAAETSDDDLRDRAVRAAAWSKSYYLDSDRYLALPNWLDVTEAQDALTGFLAAFRATSDPEYLSAASDFATLLETQIYFHEFPTYSQVLTLYPYGDFAEADYDFYSNTFPSSGVIGQGRGFTGYQIGSYQGLNLSPTASTPDFYELYTLTRDPHYLVVARMLQHSSNRVSDWDGKAGWHQRGIAALVTTVVTRVPAGTTWMVWESIVAFWQLDGLVRLQDAWGSYSVDDLAGVPEPLGFLDVRHLVVMDARETGMYLSGGQQNVTLRNSIVRRSGSHAVRVEPGVSRVSAYSCSFADSGGSGVSDGGELVSLNGCTIRGNARYGIEADASAKGVSAIDCDTTENALGQRNDQAHDAMTSVGTYEAAMIRGGVTGMRFGPLVMGDADPGPMARVIIDGVHPWTTDSGESVYYGVNALGLVWTTRGSGAYGLSKDGATVRAFTGPDSGISLSFFPDAQLFRDVLSVVRPVVPVFSHGFVVGSTRLRLVAMGANAAEPTAFANGVGFYGVAPPPSRPDASDLRTLLTALANMGLVIDRTTA